MLKHRVHTHESQQREQAVAGGNHLRVTVRGAHQRVHQPGLAADFSGHPSGCICDVRKRQAEQENPQHPPAAKELAAPQQERRDHHDRDEHRPQPHHDVIAEIQQLDVRRATDLAGKALRPFTSAFHAR